MSCLVYESVLDRRHPNVFTDRIDPYWRRCWKVFLQYLSPSTRLLFVALFATNLGDLPFNRWNQDGSQEFSHAIAAYPYEILRSSSGPWWPRQTPGASFEGKHFFELWAELRLSDASRVKELASKLSMICCFLQEDLLCWKSRIGLDIIDIIITQSTRHTLDVCCSVVRLLALASAYKGLPLLGFCCPPKDWKVRTWFSRAREACKPYRRHEEDDEWRKMLHWFCSESEHQVQEMIDQLLMEFEYLLQGIEARSSDGSKRK